MFEDDVIVHASGFGIDGGKAVGMTPGAKRASHLRIGKSPRADVAMDSVPAQRHWTKPQGEVGVGALVHGFKLVYLGDDRERCQSLQNASIPMKSGHHGQRRVNCKGMYKLHDI